MQTDSTARSNLQKDLSEFRRLKYKVVQGKAKLMNPKARADPLLFWKEGVPSTGSCGRRVLAIPASSAGVVFSRWVGALSRHPAAACSPRQQRRWR